jgi:uncharacterized SAM-binding protein YcdF (DUF218 family)
VEWFLTKALSTILLPPLSLILIGFAGLWIQRRRRLVGNVIVVFSFVAFYALATTTVAQALQKIVETQYTPEYGGDNVGDETLERVRYAARLYRLVKKPVLVTGGNPQGYTATEGELMSKVLREEFGIPVKWIEARAKNTRENALFSAEMLNAAEIKQIYLVTHAWHVRRARAAFESAGLRVTPAATGFATDVTHHPFRFLPNANSMQRSCLFLHELLGIAWYKLRN